VEAAAQPLQGNRGRAARGDQPVNALHAFTAALSTDQLAAATAYFTREGCLITPDGTAVYGRADISCVLSQLTARHTQIEVEQVAVRTAGDVAFASGCLTMRSDGPEETRFVQACDLSLVLHRVEAAWKIAILGPWGETRHRLA
jgi:ketosteroid isomerase-like protein